MKRRGYTRVLCLMLGVWMLLPALTFAQLSTSRIFTNGMVLQRDANIPVWGSCDPFDTISVTVNASSATTLADQEGNWLVTLDPMSAGGPYQMIITSGEQTFTRSDVYIGDVYMASGQSNMEMALSSADGGAAEAAAANYPSIRQFKVPKTVATEPSDVIPTSSSWTPATSSYAGNFSALAYYFARDLQAEIDVPIGIINTAYGGARIEAFMSDGMLGFDETWVTLANGENERQPTLIYNAMIHPFLRVPIKGIIWYQGESNADSREDALAYGELFQRMINAYRQLWDMPGMPFLWVQLPNFSDPADELAPGTWDAWPQLRAGQSRALALPNTGEVITIDVGDVDIHPTNKEPVGARLALLARAEIYAGLFDPSSPRYKTHELLADGKVKIEFDHVAGGLVATGDQGDSLRWFSIADANGNLYPAKAVLDGDSVIVWNDAVAEPAVVRYAWEYNPEGVNLYNDSLLPAAPFMIDVVYPGFSISEFNATDTLLERGSSAILTWKVYGANDITLNGEPVDSIGGMEVWPLDTTEYMLIATSRLNPEDKDTVSIRIDVIDPLPTIFIESRQGDLVEPEVEVTITAGANAPGGGSVTQVEFFVDEVSIGVDAEYPYEVNWLPPDTGDYAITAVVTNDMGVSATSNTIHLTVSYIILIIYEAEEATLVGGSIQNSSQCSGNKYVDLQDAFVLTFNGVLADSAGEYMMHIRYRLNYESPKSQDLYVNEEFIEQIAFTAPNTSSWQTYKINVNLPEGENEVKIVGVWNWMSFDYIALAVPGVPEDTTSDTTALVEHRISGEATHMKITPNPTSGLAILKFTLPEEGDICLDILDMAGKQVAHLSEARISAGENSMSINISDLNEGIYLLKMSQRNVPIAMEQIVIRR